MNEDFICIGYRCSCRLELPQFSDGLAGGASGDTTSLPPPRLRAPCLLIDYDNPNKRFIFVHTMPLETE